MVSFEAIRTGSALIATSREAGLFITHSRDYYVEQAVILLKIADLSTKGGIIGMLRKRSDGTSRAVQEHGTLVKSEIYHITPLTP